MLIEDTSCYFLGGGGGGAVGGGGCDIIYCIYNACDIIYCIILYTTVHRYFVSEIFHSNTCITIYNEDKTTDT